ncbi:MAG: bifunctional hydroxymethylpyrimidine kinase/phosphomethylpyrimidine kinase [Bacteroidaceae bacterium]|nr:bifunctional hydroxymethylpyrimidine kinase/phosphomethylpyrimidine kinase [Bacteroidaceae bacterium]
MEIVLTIAGSDSSAGAGIQQDLKTMTVLGTYGATVITAITSQNTLGVQGVMPVPKDVVESQLRSVLSDLSIGAVKIGQIPNADVAHVVASTILEHYHTQQVLFPIVYDPVMISTSGHELMSSDAVSTVISELFPICTLITPNIPEAEFLVGRELICAEDVVEAGRELVSLFGTNFLIKGGHGDGKMMVDRLFLIDGSMHEFETEKVCSKNLHGTGCTLSSAIAVGMAKRLDMKTAVAEAKDYVTRAIEGGKDLKIGAGNGPLWGVGIVKSEK